MNKFGKISLITTGALIALAGGGAVLFNTVPSLKNLTHNNNAQISIGNGIGDIVVDTDNTSKEYIALINQYSREIESLKTQINNNNAEHERQVAEMQNEINALQLELDDTREEDAELVAEKNARIQVLRQYIQTMEQEHDEIVADYEAEIADLNALLSNYEKEIISTIKLPADFQFTSLGFRLIEGNDFVFYSTSHSCKLYYYHFDIKTLETIPIKGTSFDSFYKHNNSLYFRTSKISYVYDFTNKTLDILGSANGIVSYIADSGNMYMFDYTGGYAIHNMVDGTFINFLGDGSDSGTVTLKKVDGYILHSAYGTTTDNNKKHYNIQVFDTETFENRVLYDSSSIINSFVKSNYGYFACLSTGFYRFNIEDYSLTLIQDLGYSTSSCYVLEEKVVVFGYYKAYIYDGTNITNILTYSSSSNVQPKFIKIKQGMYYVVSSSSNFQGIWKLDLKMNNLVQISEAFNSYQDRVTIAHYEFISMYNGIYVIDLDTGSIDTMTTCTTQNYGKFITLETEKYVLFNLSTSNYKTSYIYFYDKENDNYGKIYHSNSLTIYDWTIKNNILYVMTESSLYGFNLDASLDNYVTLLSINGSLSNLDAGVFYSSVGTLDDGKLYIKYILKDDGSFDKEMVIM